MDHAITIKELGVIYPTTSGTRTEAVKSFNLEVKRGEFLTLIGSSGCGKSTILNVIAGLVAPTHGEVSVEGERVEKPIPDRIAMMFQEYTLYPWRNVLRNVEFGLEIRGIPSGERKARAMKYVELVGLQDFLDKYPRELSGGMKQRVALARALTLETEIILMDEPFGALDEQTRLVLGDELVRIWEKTQKTVVFVTHSLFEAAYLSDRIVVCSARPTCVKSTLNVDAKRPRDPNSPQLDRIRSLVWDQLKNESIQLAGIKR